MSAVEVQVAADAYADVRWLAQESLDERAGEVEDRATVIARLIANTFDPADIYGGEIDFQSVKVDLRGDGSWIAGYFDVDAIGEHELRAGHYSMYVDYMRRRKDALVTHMIGSAFVQEWALNSLRRGERPEDIDLARALRAGVV